MLLGPDRQPYQSATPGAFGGHRPSRARREHPTTPPRRARMQITGTNLTVDGGMNA